MSAVSEDQREMLRAVFAGLNSGWLSATFSEGHGGLKDLAIGIELNGLGQAQVGLDTLLKLSRLLGTDNIYVETNDDMNNAPSCEIFCGGVSAEWNPSVIQ